MSSVTISGGAMPIESQQTVTVASKIISNYSVETNLELAVAATSPLNPILSVTQRISRWTGTLPPLLVVYLSAMSSSSP